jgi:Protein of unknown function (DUF3775)
MANRQRPEELEDAYAGEALTITPEQFCFIIAKPREFDVKDANSELESGSNPSGDHEIGVLEDRGDDPVQQVALAWLGRDADNTLEDWPSLRDDAANARTSLPGSTARYLLGIPILADYLDEGLTMFGKSCKDVEMGRL